MRAAHQGWWARASSITLIGFQSSVVSSHALSTFLNFFKLREASAAAAADEFRAAGLRRDGKLYLRYVNLLISFFFFKNFSMERCDWTSSPSSAKKKGFVGGKRGGKKRVLYRKDCYWILYNIRGGRAQWRRNGTEKMQISALSLSAGAMDMDTIGDQLGRRWEGTVTDDDENCPPFQASSTKERRRGVGSDF